MRCKVKVSFTQHRILCSRNDLNDLAVSYHTLSLSEGQDASGAMLVKIFPPCPPRINVSGLACCVCFSPFPHIEERIHKAGIS